MSGDLTVQDVRDVTWLVALWKAIHGGDPGPEGGLAVQIDGATLELGARFVASLAAANGAQLNAEDLTEALTLVGVAPRAVHEFCRAGDTVVEVKGAAAIELFLEDSGPGTTLVGETITDSDEVVAYFCVNGRLLNPAPGEPHLP
jgi:hypothetical protein